MIDCASVGQFKEGMGFIHLLQICLQESSCYNAPKHAEFCFGRAVTGAGGVEKGSVDSRVVADLGMPSL